MMNYASGLRLMVMRMIMSDFVWSIFIGIGIVVMALGIVAWITLRRIREEEARRQ